MSRRLWFAVGVVALMLPAMALAQQINIAQTLGTSSFTITPYDPVSPYGISCIDGSGLSCEAFSGASAVTFQYDLYDAYNPGLQYANLSAELTWNAISYSTPYATGSSKKPGVEEDGFFGTFSITTAGGGFNLLSGSFTDASLTLAGLTANFGDSGLAPDPVFSSSLLIFPANTTFALNIATTLTNSESQDSNGFLTQNTAWGVTTFSSSPPPQFSPEPTTVFLSGGALLGMGYLLGRRKKRRPVS